MTTPATVSPQPTATTAPLPAMAPAKPARAWRRWLRRRRGMLLTTFVLLAVIAVVLYVRIWSPVAARTHRATRGPILAEVHGRGTIESDREVQLGFDMVGRLSEVFPDVNERLNGGFGCYKCTEKLTAMPVEVQGLDPISCSG